MAQEKMFISYNEIHQAICDCVTEQQVYERFKPTLIIAIGSGGFIPGRMLRTFLKQKCGKSLPIQTIGLVLYDDNLDTYDVSTATVRKTQWLNYSSGEGAGISLQGHNVLIVDEVDDTRKTLHYAVAELAKDVVKQRAEYEAQRGPEDPAWKEPNLGVFVVHNKIKDKAGSLPPDLLESRYFKCMDVPDNWIVYPWDALDIYEHQARADERISAAAAKANGEPEAKKAKLDSSA